MDAVALEAVSKRYGRHDDVEALHEVSATFPEGTFTAVMGLSGSGKSTLLQCASGLDRPTSGRVWLGGVEIENLNRRDLTLLRRRRVGFVFQSFNLVPTLSVAENIALPLRLDGRHVDKEVVVEMAKRVDVADQLQRLPDTLSGGQQQRVAIARALVTKPDVVFADEPTAALDPYTSEAILDILSNVVEELGQTVVIVTHEPAVAAYTSRVMLLDQGQLVGIDIAPEPTELREKLHRLGAHKR